MLTLAVKIEPVGADQAQSGLELTMEVGKTDYILGEPINVTLTVTNISNQTINFTLVAWTFDFLVYNDTGPIYQWSSFKVFPHWIEILPLAPGDNITNVLTWPQTCNVTDLSQGIQVSPGTYYILGEIPSYGLLAGPVKVNVDQLIRLVPLKTVVGKGYDLILNVSIMNLDDAPEAFDVTLFSNATAIGTETGVNVSRGTLTLSFTWNTASFELGNYNLNVLAGNLSAATSVVLTIPGDINGDFKVTMDDVMALLYAFGSTPGKPNWNPNCDIDGNGRVDMGDVIIALRNFGRHYP
jgi:hypothetical protein